jgi:hypothetical protein
MRKCPRKVRCPCCIADPEIRLREGDGAWKVLRRPKSDGSGWKLWEIDDAEKYRSFLKLTRVHGMLSAVMFYNNGAIIG